MIRKLFILIFSISFGFFNVSYAERNLACSKGSKAVVFQVLDQGVLAFICPRFNFEYDSDITACKIKGRLVYLTHNNNYVDNQMIKLKRNQCFAEGGAYQYKNKEGDIKTVREIDIINSRW